MSDFVNKIFKKNPYFCPAPFTSLVQDYQGRSGPCPYNSGCFDLSKIDIKERWTAAAPTELRRQHLNGEKPSTCQRCYSEEESGFLSYRQLEQNQLLKTTEEEINNGIYKNGAKALVLRLSNICNYACRTCHSLDSSLFKAEGDFYAQTYGDINSRYVQKDDRREFSSDEMQEISKTCSNVESIEFYGGEPLLNTTHYTLLSELIATDRAANISLFYCTNGSTRPSAELKALLSQFKKVHFNFSLDGINENYHYIRWPGDWDKVEKNLEFYTRDLPKQMACDVTFGVNITVSILNIFYLPEILEKLKSYFLISSLHLSTVHEPKYYAVVNIPPGSKEIIKKKLQNSRYNEKLAGTIGFMMSREYNPAIWKKFVIWTEKKDKYRKVQIEQALPEFYEMVKSEYSAALDGFKTIEK